MAFGNIERGGDPGGVADTSVFNLMFGLNGQRYFNKVKIGVAYSMLIFNKKIEGSEEKKDKFIEMVIKTDNEKELMDIVGEYEEYFKISR